MIKLFLNGIENKQADPWDSDVAAMAKLMNEDWIKVVEAYCENVRGARPAGNKGLNAAR